MPPSISTQLSALLRGLVAHLIKPVKVLEDAGQGLQHIALS